MVWDDERAVKPPGHQIGQDLSSLSEEDLAERIEMLKAEILRLENAMRAKASVRTAADSLFRR
ncbi:DUF1192 domain-containing protein [Chthonobacter rhizosphaerae]|uniref:DUF1192 domain-containing protein n=1 Tax=Chthonobacter rhizosphaerae TaxID=2735553 RepID=UPI0015EE7496|nr:DUF1192 domain-containing protein [Chthonobacter rhizosphaerae]